MQHKLIIEFRPPVIDARLFAKVKYLEPMFGDVGQARTNAAMFLMTIAKTLSRTCTKPIVARRFSLAPNRQAAMIVPMLG